MAKRYIVHEICDAISDLSDTQESDVSDSCSKYLPEQPEPEDFDSDDSEVSSNNEPEDSANEDNDTESNSGSSDSNPTTNAVIRGNVAPGFQPHLNISQDRPCTIHPEIILNTRILDFF